jgi:hypothetical protein
MPEDEKKCSKMAREGRGSPPGCMTVARAVFISSSVKLLACVSGGPSWSKPSTVLDALFETRCYRGKGAALQLELHEYGRHETIPHFP